MATSILILGVVAMLAVIVATLVVIAMARRNHERDEPPPSEPTDFVAPVSAGAFRWRRPDERPDDFKQRVADERRASERPPGR